MRDFSVTDASPKAVEIVAVRFTSTFVQDSTFVEWRALEIPGSTPVRYGPVSGFGGVK